MKFLVTDAQAREVEHRLRSLLAPDPHVDPSQQGYLVSSLYCDTPQMHVLQRVGRFRPFKFRLRRYGDTPRVFLERKFRREDRVRKRRATIGLDDLAHFVQAELEHDAEAAWYRRQLLRHELRPVCLIQYQRLAYFSRQHETPVRLTFDRQLRGGLTQHWSFEVSCPMRSLLAERVVCEFKFHGALPAAFKSVLGQMQLVPCGVSKYRHCMLACSAGDGAAPDA